MQFLVLTQRYAQRFTEAEFAAVLPAETQAARALYAQARIRQIWSRGDLPGSCFVLEAESLSDAEALVATLPFAQKQLSAFQIVALNPYRGFGPQESS